MKLENVGLPQAHLEDAGGETPSYTIKIPSNISTQFRWLCDKLPDLEWSGVIWYQTDGDTFEIKDFLLRDIGTAGHTQFNYDEVTQYIIAHPELLMLPYGLVHSHNKMSVFFSGEDNRELIDNTVAMKKWLSLIVNNKGEAIGRVCFYDEVEQITSSSSKFFQWIMPTVTTLRKTVWYYDCNIQMEIVDVIPSTLRETFNKLNIPKPVPQINHTQAYQGHYGTVTNHKGVGKQKTIFDNTGKAPLSAAVISFQDEDVKTIYQALNGAQTDIDRNPSIDYFKGLQEEYQDTIDILLDSNEYDIRDVRISVLGIEPWKQGKFSKLVQTYLKAADNILKTT